MPQRLERAEGLSAPAQHEIADGPTPEVLGGICDGGADANAGAEELVGRLEPGSGVDGVSIAVVVEEAVAAEISHHRRAGVNADPGYSKIHPGRLPALPKLFSPVIEIVGAGNRPGGEIGLVTRRVEKDLDAIADHLGDRAFVRENDFRHSAHILVEQGAEYFRRGG